jgi:hypothetical protein
MGRRHAEQPERHEREHDHGTGAVERAVGENWGIGRIGLDPIPPSGPVRMLTRLSCSPPVSVASQTCTRTPSSGVQPFTARTWPVMTKPLPSDARSGASGM